MPAAGLLEPASARPARSREESDALRSAHRGSVCEDFREAVLRARLQEAPELRDPGRQLGGVLPPARQGGDGRSPHQAVLSRGLHRTRRVRSEGHEKPRGLSETHQEGPGLDPQVQALCRGGVHRQANVRPRGQGHARGVLRQARQEGHGQHPQPEVRLPRLHQAAEVRPRRKQDAGVLRPSRAGGDGRYLPWAV